jgi:hypothetical protein
MYGPLNVKIGKENSCFPYRLLHCNIYSCNQQMHTTVIRFTTIFLKTFNSYMFRTLLVHHQGAHCYCVKQLTKN